MNDLIAIYNKIKPEIELRLRQFNNNYYDKEKRFMEFIFCMLTPQSKAEVCWNAVLELKRKGLLYAGKEEEIVPYLKGVRFKNKKARYILENRSLFDELALDMEDNKMLRDLLVRKVKGYGYKEASHFLRNIGKGHNLAILDRHILKSLSHYGVIDEIPSSLSRSKYLEIEHKMGVFSDEIGIPMIHLDFVLWYKATGRVFK